MCEEKVADKYSRKPPIDIYDMVSTCLSEESVALGGAPVIIHDFTNGKWIKREPFDKGKYCLEEIDESLFK